MQLDLFEHSRDVMLRNAVVEAIRARDADRAKSAMIALQAAYPADTLVPELDALVGKLAMSPWSGGLAPDEAAVEVRATEKVLVPAAQRILGEDAAAWLAPFWRALAEAIVGQAYEPEAPHAAWLYLRAGDWQAAIDAIETIPSWRRKPGPLGWMVEALYRRTGAPALWPMSAELAWMAPQAARSLLARLADNDLSKQLKCFDRECEAAGESDGFAWFPAWLLIEDSGYATLIGAAEKSNDRAPERGARLILALLSLERQGRHAELIENRRRLRDLDGALFAHYMKSR
ncbi:hypothetical protein BURK2_02450 [Burkholderiales bacterium]|nr:MAG: hypothetical protein F9K47_08790 [Burkholderiales bacterium]CAG0992125.1 hypothetical protein BURK2_02450 [Burkholderiales bacterium]